MFEIVGVIADAKNRGIAVVVVVMAISAAAACYFPARRATRVDPMVALRGE